MRWLAILITTLWGTSTAMSEEDIFAKPLVLKCQATEMHGMSDDWRQIDRIEVDVEKLSITFSISKTFGTDHEKYWPFTNRVDSLFHDHAVFQRDGEFLAIAAIYTNIPVAILVSRRSTVQMVWLYPVAVKYVKYACE